QRAVVPVLKAGGAGGEVGRTASVAAAGQRDAGQRRLAAALIRAGTVRRMAVRAGRAAGLAALTKRRARGVRLADLRSTVTAASAGGVTPTVVAAECGDQQREADGEREARQSGHSGPSRMVVPTLCRHLHRRLKSPLSRRRWAVRRPPAAEGRAAVPDRARC